jgi:hypothetical protein
LLVRELRVVGADQEIVAGAILLDLGFRIGDRAAQRLNLLCEPNDARLSRGDDIPLGFIVR